MGRFDVPAQPLLRPPARQRDLRRQHRGAGSGSQLPRGRRGMHDQRHEARVILHRAAQAGGGIGEDVAGPVHDTRLRVGAGQRQGTLGIGIAPGGQRLAPSIGDRLRRVPGLTQSLRWHAGLRVVRCTMPVYRACRERRIPAVAAVAHAGGIEHQTPHRLVEAFAGHRFHRKLQPDEGLTRIVDARARRDHWYQGLVGRILAPVRQAGRMAEHVAHADPLNPRRLAEVAGPRVVHQWRIQRQFAAVDQLQHGVREYRLAQRSRFPQRRVLDWRAAFGIGDTEAARPRKRARLHHRDADTGHAQRLHLPRQVAQEVPGRRPVRVRVDGGRSTQPQRAQYGKRKAGTQQAAAGNGGHRTS